MHENVSDNDGDGDMGIVFSDFKERSTIANFTYYTTLWHKLGNNIFAKRRAKLTEGVQILHDRAPVHRLATPYCDIHCLVRIWF